MNVVWTDLAKQQLRQVAKYIRKEFGRSARDKFIHEIGVTNHLLAEHHYMGIVEPLFEGCDKAYRSFVTSRHDKIIYFVGATRIEVVAFWDCRQNPLKLLDYIR